MPVLNRKEWKVRQAELQREAIAIVSAGQCPQCGSGLKRNLSISGWWQCEQYGDGHFRARPNDPKCSFQCFTS